MHLDLFSGIGGFAYAIDQVYGNETKHIFCEIDPFCQEVLKKHWPEAKIYGDIRNLTADSGSEEQRGVSSGKRQEVSEIGECNILTGGFPCQPFSQAGRRKGTDDDRHLWPEMLRVIREFKPEWVIAENVAGLLTIQQGVVFGQVCADLEGEGYEVQPFVIPAVSVNAPHRRDRVWIIAHSAGKRGGGRDGEKRGISKREIRTEEREGSSLRGESERRAGNASDIQIQRRRAGGKAGSTLGGNGATLAKHECNSWSQNWVEVATRLCRVDDGLPAELDGFKLSKAGHRVARLKALGNAIVPQVAIEILKAIKEIK